MDDIDAADLLTRLGFTEYEAEALVTLLSAPGSTATEVAEASALPRSRVYDVMESLADRGYVEVCEGDPRQFRATPTDVILEDLESRYDRYVSSLDDRLEDLERQTSREECRSQVWSVTGADQALARGQELVDGAADSVAMVASGDLLDQECLATLRRATDRGVDVVLYARDADDREWLRDAVPDAAVGPAPAFLDDALVRVQIVDDRAVAIATRTQASPTSSPSVDCVVAEGERNGVVVFARQVLGTAGGAP